MLTFYLGTIILCLLVISYSALHSFSSVSTILNKFTNQRIPEITRNANLATLSQQLLYETERLSSSTTALTRHLAYQKATNKFEEILVVFAGQNNNRPEDLHLKIIKTTIDDLHDLVTRQSELTIQAETLLNKTIALEQKLHTLSHNKKHLSEVHSQDLSHAHSDDLYSLWIFTAMDVLSHGTQVLTITDVNQLKNFEKKTQQEVQRLKTILQHMPSVLAADITASQTEIESLLLSHDGLTSTTLHKLKVSQQKRKKGEFTRNIVSKFDKKNNELFAKIITDTSRQASDTSKKVINATLMFFIVSLLIILLSFGAIFYFHSKLTVRLVQLNNALQKKISGQNSTIDVCGNDEITDMAKSFLYYANEVEMREQQLTKLATTDPLTGLKNRRSFLGDVEKQMAISQRHNDNISFIMIDVDHFKSINDSYGHKTGDILLQNIAKAFRSALREEDILGRIGGEEFAVFLVRPQQEYIIQVAERLRSVIAETQWLIEDNEIECSVSAGVSYVRQTDETISQLMHRADLALYKAKESGRNQVITEDL